MDQWAAKMTNPVNRLTHLAMCTLRASSIFRSSAGCVLSSFSLSNTCGRRHHRSLIFDRLQSWWGWPSHTYLWIWEKPAIDILGVYNARIQDRESFSKNLASYDRTQNESICQAFGGCSFTSLCMWLTHELGSSKSGGQNHFQKCNNNSGVKGPQHFFFAFFHMPSCCGISQVRAETWNMERTGRRCRGNLNGKNW